MKDELAFAFETLTIASADGVVNLTRPLYDPAAGGGQCRKALLTVNPGPVVSYFLANTGTVSSTNGHKLAAYGSLVIEGYNNIRSLQMTSQSSGTTGSVSVTYYRGCA